MAFNAEALHVSSIATITCIHAEAGAHSQSDDLPGEEATLIDEPPCSGSAIPQVRTTSIDKTVLIKAWLRYSFHDNLGTRNVGQVIEQVLREDVLSEEDSATLVDDDQPREECLTQDLDSDLDNVRDDRGAGDLDFTGTWMRDLQMPASYYEKIELDLEAETAGGLSDTERCV